MGLFGPIIVCVCYFGVGERGGWREDVLLLCGNPGSICSIHVLEVVFLHTNDPLNYGVKPKPYIAMWQTKLYLPFGGDMG